MKLILPKHVLDDIREAVRKTRRDVETGVSLFGICLGETVILAAAGPGPSATHRSLHYSSDTEFTNTVYTALQSALPSIEWLGEFHVHPAGMIRLSGGDLETIREIILGTDDTLHPASFIAGVMQRTKDGLEIYPFYFDRTRLESHAEPDPMELQLVEANDEIVRKARTAACRARDGGARVRKERERSRDTAALRNAEDKPRPSGIEIETSEKRQGGNI
jgi:hypothetical protein